MCKYLFLAFLSLGLGYSGLSNSALAAAGDNIAGKKIDSKENNLAKEPENKPKQNKEVSKEADKVNNDEKAIEKKEQKEIKVENKEEVKEPVKQQPKDEKADVKSSVSSVLFSPKIFNIRFSIGGAASVYNNNKLGVKGQFGGTFFAGLKVILNFSDFIKVFISPELTYDYIKVNDEYVKFNNTSYFAKGVSGSQLTYQLVNNDDEVLCDGSCLTTNYRTINQVIANINDLKDYSDYQGKVKSRQDYIEQLKQENNDLITDIYKLAAETGVKLSEDSQPKYYFGNLYIQLKYLENIRNVQISEFSNDGAESLYEIISENINDDNVKARLSTLYTNFSNSVTSKENFLKEEYTVPATDNGSNSETETNNNTGGNEDAGNADSGNEGTGSNEGTEGQGGSEDSGNSGQGENSGEGTNNSENNNNNSENNNSNDDSNNNANNNANNNENASSGTTILKSELLKEINELVPDVDLTDPAQLSKFLQEGDLSSLTEEQKNFLSILANYNANITEARFILVENLLRNSTLVTDALKAQIEKNEASMDSKYLKILDNKDTMVYVSEKNDVYRILYVKDHLSSSISSMFSYSTKFGLTFWRISPYLKVSIGSMLTSNTLTLDYIGIAGMRIKADEIDSEGIEFYNIGSQHVSKTQKKMSFMYGVGAGLSFKICDNLDIFLEYNYKYSNYVLNYSIDIDSRFSGTPHKLKYSQTFNIHSLSLGLNVTF